MKLEQTSSDRAMLQLIGKRLAHLRLYKNLTQQQLAEQAGLGLRTVQRLELGASATQLSGFVRVCRVLGLMEQLDAIIPEPAISPMAQLKRQGQQRKRASGSITPPNTPKKWTWGEPV
jgi:transcriptional regulator with XRE-family HTH domain